LVNTPPGWGHCESALRELREPTELGFVGTAGDLNRFRSRYRLAKSFREILLNAYASGTAAGYSSLFRVFLTWSAFELFLEICGADIAGMQRLIPAYGSAAAGAAIRATPRHEAFLSFVRARLDSSTQKRHFHLFLGGSPCNLLYLPLGIRHIFVHGELTPHSGAESPYPATEVARILSDFLFAVMDGEFSRRLRAKGLNDRAHR
jgi:hypothetical protein